MNAHHTEANVAHSENHDLDELYAAWRDDRSGANPRPLKEWLLSVPTQSESLVQWTSEAALLQCADVLPENPDLVARVEQIGRRAVAAYRSKTAVVTQPMTSIKAAAERSGMTLKTLAATLEIGLPIIVKLEQRLLQVETIPARLIARLSETLKLSRDQVRSYLAQPPTLSAAALYKADSAPRAGTREPFAHAIQTCAGMTAEQRQMWLTEPAESE